LLLFDFKRANRWPGYLAARWRNREGERGRRTAGTAMASRDGAKTAKERQTASSRNSLFSTDFKADFQDLNGDSDNVEGFFNEEPS